MKWLRRLKNPFASISWGLYTYNYIGVLNPLPTGPWIVIQSTVLPTAPWEAPWDWGPAYQTQSWHTGLGRGGTGPLEPDLAGGGNAGPNPRGMEVQSGLWTRPTPLIWPIGPTGWVLMSYTDDVFVDKPWVKQSCWDQGALLSLGEATRTHKREEQMRNTIFSKDNSFPVSA